MYYIITTESLSQYVVNEDMEITQLEYQFPNYLQPNFSGKWVVRGLAEVLPFGNIGRVQPISDLVGKDLKFKNGKSKYVLYDIDHGTTRLWGNRISSVSCRESL